VISRPVTVFAPAKINLGLRITGRFESGYHRLETVFAPTNLFDRLNIAPGAVDSVTHVWPPDTAIDLRRALERGAVKNPLLKKTIAFARKLRPKLPPISVRVTKRIPSPSGLGGASANAAALLRALVGDVNAADLRATASLGADVPYFLFAGLEGRSAHLNGLGHELTPIELPCAVGWICVPNFGFSTEKMFAHVRTLPLPTVKESSVARPNFTLRLNEIPVSDELLSGIKIVLNDFDAVARHVFPRECELLVAGRGVICRTLRQVAAEDWYVGLSGSGAALFAIAEAPIDQQTLRQGTGWLRGRLGRAWQVLPIKIGP